MIIKQYDAVVAGYTCVDLVPNFNKETHSDNIFDILIPGRLIEIEGMDFVLGGAVPNTGIAMKRFGKKVYLNGLIGNDVIGVVADELFKKCDIMEGMKITDKASTAFSVVISPPEIDRIFLESPGCNSIFNIEHIDFDVVQDSKLFHFGYPPLLRQFYYDKGEQLLQMFSRIQQMGVVTSLDFSLPDSDSESGRVNWLEILNKTLAYVDIFAPSLEELIKIMKPVEYKEICCSNTAQRDFNDLVPIDMIVEISNQILEMGVNILMIKAGKCGTYLFTGDGALVNLKLGNRSESTWNKRKIHCKAFFAEPDKIINTSGAGDTTIGAFLTALINGETIESALKLASLGGRNNLYCKDIYKDLKQWSEMLAEIDDVTNKIIDLS